MKYGISSWFPVTNIIKPVVGLSMICEASGFYNREIASWHFLFASFNVDRMSHLCANKLFKRNRNDKKLALFFLKIELQEFSM